jgi:hypothetical protein
VKLSVCSERGTEVSTGKRGMGVRQPVIGNASDLVSDIESDANPVSNLVFDPSTKGKSEFPAVLQNKALGSGVVFRVLANVEKGGTSTYRPVGPEALGQIKWIDKHAVDNTVDIVFDRELGERRSEVDEIKRLIGKTVLQLCTKVLSEVLSDSGPQ